MKLLVPKPVLFLLVLELGRTFDNQEKLVLLHFLKIAVEDRVVLKLQEILGAREVFSQQAQEF